jgi:rubredoxin
MNNRDIMNDDLRCPKCQADRGRAFRATVGTVWVMNYRCPSCGHEWEITKPPEANPLDLFRSE